MVVKVQTLEKQPWVVTGPHPEHSSVPFRSEFFPQRLNTEMSLIVSGVEFFFRRKMKAHSNEESLNLYQCRMSPSVHK